MVDRRKNKLFAAAEEQAADRRRRSIENSLERLREWNNGGIGNAKRQRGQGKAGWCG